MDLHGRGQESGKPCRGLYVELTMEADLYNATSASIIHIT
jgi:hypothetical protein